MLDYYGSRNFLLFPKFKNKAFVLYSDFGLEIIGKCKDLLNNDYKITCGVSIDMAENSICHNLNDNFDPIIRYSASVLDLIKCKNFLEQNCRRIINGVAVISDENLLNFCGFNFLLNKEKKTQKFSLPKDGKSFLLSEKTSSVGLGQLINKFLYEDYNEYYWFNDARLFILGIDSSINTVEPLINKVIEDQSVWVTTLSDVYNYVRAYDRLEFSVSGDKVYNPSSIGVFIRYLDKKFYLPSGEFVSLC